MSSTGPSPRGRRMRQSALHRCTSALGANYAGVRPTPRQFLQTLRGASRLDVNTFLVFASAPTRPTPDNSNTKTVAQYLQRCVQTSILYSVLAFNSGLLD